MAEDTLLSVALLERVQTLTGVCGAHVQSCKWEMQAGHPQLRSELEASLGSMSLCLKNSNKTKKLNPPKTKTKTMKQTESNQPLTNKKTSFYADA